jgi:predicted metal-binding protein
MKRFQDPQMEIVEIAVADVITASTCSEYNPNCPYETEMD